jgi:DNA-binding NarL/FixJ family response regulator
VGSAVFDTKKHNNVKCKARYRRIGKYYKSLEKFKAEKHRRKQALELQNQGLTIKQIARQLGVSERTVKRDFR